jgi:hypothetical protein
MILGEPQRFTSTISADVETEERMLDLAFIICTFYAIVRLLMSARDFFKFGGKAWQFIALLILAVAALFVWAAPLIPAIPPIGRALAFLSWIVVYGALAMMSRISVLVFETSGTSLSRKAEHACNAMLFASVLALIITGMSWLMAWFSHSMTKGM